MLYPLVTSQSVKQEVCYSSLMTRTIPADYLGKRALGYLIVAIPSENTKSKIIYLLDQLSVELPGVLWPMPAEQLHITLCEIIQPKDYSEDKETLYKLHQEQYKNAPAAIISKLPKFTVTFDTIEVSPHAIIMRASDSGTFNEIRAKLVENIQLPVETGTPPDITHSSIARYLKEVYLEKVQEVVIRHSIKIDEEISEFRLLRNEITPLQDYNVIKSFPLSFSQ